MFKLKNLLLPTLTGLLLWLAWPPLPFAPLLFFAFVPLLILNDQLKHTPKAGARIFRNSFFGFFIWNTLSLYWIYNAGQELGVAGAIGIVSVPLLLGSLLMSLPFVMFHRVRRNFGETIGLFALICCWIGYEYLHQEWQLAFPWMTLGNGLAEYHQLVQWYEYTGAFGGTLWILLANIIVYSIYKKYKLLKTEQKSLTGLSWLSIRLALHLAIPLGLSLWMYNHYQEEGNPSNVVVVQPNVDPFSEKFNGLPPEMQLERLIRLSDSLGQPNTEFFIWPETAIIPLVREDNLPYDQSVELIQRFLSKYKNGNVLTGAVTVKWYNDKKTSTARYNKESSRYYDVYNAGLLIENLPKVQVYHKSKLVPGVESYPYSSVLGFLGNIVIDLGGTSGGYGKDNANPVLYTQSGIGIAPAVCYESIFGSFMADHVLRDAQLLAIITNDGWWKNTSGYKQHLQYAKLRAIETRRSIARSANTGISAFINQRGDIIKQTSWWTQTAIKADLNLNTKLTFYSKYGDIIAVLGSIFAFGFIMLSFLWRFISKGRPKFNTQ
ncbi:apolipoprotein N-acyltransferase [Solitalea sp. MAHUQ-68]|uniref:Apolipoprotein N-acyltransferase n=1 Tax=Solitalea agri TaxID=2953739 RepID=A0A9X2JFK7_9SPHI|nr:apolipoprotein N-acyltransferase [Solitalea agri]MCO4293531.1 apolipoprotein N-acyltransferase [Solitalea agri]